ncbi:hypothetical protein H6G89_12395 [Oscillatoria sp. FACHB-1407]|uniref:hypothetical protein n=1 Tax=Oscillatoria sp. FACHB-1407 TaxID=2692847 RepID=UPI00168419FC|nr:hypothetical protein [Oscillatoria sp. FACHB-1407]MBD2461848.1 hypothetical protein [Oscillatoria sp. FACHB-1407]
MLDSKGHLEVRWVPEKPPSPPSPDNGFGKNVAIALVTIVLFIAVQRAFEASSSTVEDPSLAPNPEDVSQDERLEVVEQSVAVWGLPTNEEPNNSLQPLEEKTSRPIPRSQTQINDCNGMNYDGANFRDEPALTPLTIRGIAPQGAWVTLTGETTQIDGVTWYQVINHAELLPSPEPGAQNRTRANQVGWIADCFLD